MSAENVRAVLAPSLVDQGAVDEVGRRLAESGFEAATHALCEWVTGGGTPTTALVAELRYWLDHMDRPQVDGSDEER